MTTKKHHIVPCVYLRQFWDIDEGRKTKIWIFDKVKGTERLQMVKQVFTKNHFYSLLNTDGTYNVALEELLGEIEGTYPIILEKICNTGSLNEDESQLFWIFVGIQLFRTERGKNLLAEALGISDRNDILGAMLDGGISISTILREQFDTFLYFAPDGTSFATSDNPVFWRILHSEQPDPGWHNPFELIFPLSHKNLIIMRHKGIYANPENLQFVPCGNVDENFIKRVNSEICNKGATRYTVCKDQETIVWIRTYVTPNTPVVAGYDRVVFDRRRTTTE